MSEEKGVRELAVEAHIETTKKMIESSDAHRRSLEHAAAQAVLQLLEKGPECIKEIEVYYIDDGHTEWPVIVWKPEDLHLAIIGDQTFMLVGPCQDCGKQALGGDPFSNFVGMGRELRLAEELFIPCGGHVNGSCTKTEKKRKEAPKMTKDEVLIAALKEWVHAQAEV